jgi:elongation factor P
MIGVTDLKSGATFRMDGQLFVVLKYEHTKMGRGTATIKVKVRNLKSGAVLDKSFISGAKVEPIQTVRQEMTFMYADEDAAYFMHPETYEQSEVALTVVGDDLKYLREGGSAFVLLLEEEGKRRPLAVDLPVSMVFEVTEADPGVKGDSAANMLKKVTLENGTVVSAPLFIKVGDKLKVDTRSGEYVERVSISG